MNPLLDEPAISLLRREHDEPGVEVRVNFGVFAGREATPAEIDRLAEWLLDEVGEISIISEERHEIDAQVEASVHQVRIEVAADRVPEDAAARAELEQRILERAEHWAHVCVAERHAEVSDAF
jgi:DNA-directed RNA polymerase sigma subunit (sigma70/sigma32)